ncbi:glycosyltransferase family 4 protein [Acidiluteibacter ferrifornacis]|uniref:Glycosyltransferase n=1 Tax=Acidiluteibacter ferrifornacis TaxID=2692424 RepID=A0A6N9NMG2_9FLAO|nr:glycosyltransferase family 4 protein [Acidiluteibacter ferrifornacis]NBG66651.1 glycosyltransferase [Acidiluteibacter ferrifornacis]
MIKRKKFKVIVSHPIQYHAVLWRSLPKIEGLDVEVFFCSDHGQQKSLDKDFGVSFSWDIPLRDGYKSKVFKNYGFGNGFFKYINFSLIISILSTRNDFVYFHGVNSFTSYLSFWISKIKGSKIIVRNIAHLNGEPNRSKFNRLLRDFVYGSVYRNASYCLYTGRFNKEFFKSFRVKVDRLIHAPHVVDNDFFKQRELDGEEYFDFKERLSIERNEVVLMFCGKYTAIKQPIMLLDAFQNSILKCKATLLFIGDGILRDSLLNKAQEINEPDNFKRVLFLGFKNQTELPAYYSIADILVLPSIRETWGLVVNEALNFSTSIIVSSDVACGPELVENKTGVIFNKNSQEELKSSIEQLVNDDKLLKKYKNNGKKIIMNWSVNEYVEVIKKIVNG